MNHGENWKRWYDALRSHDRELFNKAIGAAEAVAVNHGVSLKVASEIERAFVVFACELRGVKLLSMVGSDSSRGPLGID